MLNNKIIPEDAVGLAHFQLSRSCIRYMCTKEIVGISLIQQENWHSVERKFPFLKFAVTFWVAHAKIVEK